MESHRDRKGLDLEANVPKNLYDRRRKKQGNQSRRKIANSSMAGRFVHARLTQGTLAVAGFLHVRPHGVQIVRGRDDGKEEYQRTAER